MGHYYRRMTLFDTLRASQQLQEAGFEAPQADALVTVFAEDLGDRVATKDDVLSLREDLTNALERLREDLTNALERLREDLTNTDERLREDLTNTEERLRGELTNTEERLRGEMRELEHRLVNRIYLAVGAGTTFLAAVMGVCTAVIVAFG